MSSDSRVPRWVRARVFLGCMVAACASGVLATLLGGAQGLGQSIVDLSSVNLQDGMIAGVVLGILPGLIVGGLSQERLAKTGRARILWTSLFHASVLTFLPVFLLVFVATASSAAC